MFNINYINYNDLDDFYTISQICTLFNMDRNVLKERCNQFKVMPRRNDIGEIGLVRYDVRRLHNAIYYDGKEKPFTSIDEAFEQDAKKAK